MRREDIENEDNDKNNEHNYDDNDDFNLLFQVQCDPGPQGGWGLWPQQANRWASREVLSHDNVTLPPPLNLQWRSSPITLYFFVLISPPASIVSVRWPLYSASHYPAPEVGTRFFFFFAFFQKVHCVSRYDAIFVHRVLYTRSLAFRLNAYFTCPPHFSKSWCFLMEGSPSHSSLSKPHMSA